MLPTRRLLSFTLLLAFTLSACTGGAANNDGPTPTRTAAPLEATHVSPTVTSASPDSEAAATSTPEPLQQVGGFVILPDELHPPSDYVDVFQAKVEAGEITYEQGLIAALKLYAGDASGLEILGDAQPVTGEGNVLLGYVHQYLATGADPATKAELQQLLSVIAPSAEQLLRFAAPEPKAGGRGRRGLQRVALRTVGAPPDPIQCQELWAEGFPQSKQAICFQYTSVSLTNGTGRVFYPAWWWPGDSKLPYAQAAAEALVDADKSFAQFGPMRSLDLVFTTLSFPGKSNVLAMTPTTDKQAPVCQVIVYPHAITDATNKKSVEVFKQTIAHEVFHCFQVWNIPSHTTANYPSGTEWWVEGTAEYFSNVVYPTANDEWSRVDDFDRNSATKPLYQLSYENTVFFQYLGQTLGNARLIELLKSLPGDSDPKVSADALAAVPGMQTTFHEFAQTWADRQIPDTGGGFLPNTTYIASSDQLVVGGPDHQLEAQPLLLKRYLFIFPPENIYQVSTQFSGAEGMSSARPDYTTGTWANLTPEIGPGCDEEKKYVFLLTSAAQSTDSRTGTLHASFEEDENCKPTPEPQPSHQGQTACDHPYLPLRPGATWTYSHPNGPRTWIVDSVAPAADTDSQATALMRALVAGQEFKYTWNCSVAGGLTVWWNGSVDDGGEAKCELAEAEGVLLRTVLALETEWVSHTKTACSGSTMLGVNGRMVQVTDDILKVIGMDKVTLPDGRVVDGLQIDRQGTTFSQAEVEGITSKPLTTEHHYTWVLARGVGIVQFGEDMTLTSYSVP